MISVLWAEVRETSQIVRSGEATFKTERSRSVLNKALRGPITAPGPGGPRKGSGEDVFRHPWSGQVIQRPPGRAQSPSQGPEKAAAQSPWPTPFLRWKLTYPHPGGVPNPGGGVGGVDGAPSTTILADFVIGFTELSSNAFVRFERQLTDPVDVLWPVIFASVLLRHGTDLFYKIL